MKRTGTGAIRRSESGQALVETALVIPILFVLMLNVVNFGAYFYAWIAVSSAARAGAQYLAAAGISVSGGKAPTAAAVTSLVLNDIGALPNHASTVVCVSTSNDKTATCSGSITPVPGPPAADPGEGTPPVSYASAAVDVSYPYTAFVASWAYLTVMPSKVQRRAQMRLLQ